MQAKPAQLRGQKPRRRSVPSGRGTGPRGSHPRGSRRRPGHRVRPRTWAVLGFFFAAIAILGFAALERALAPAGNIQSQRVDAIIVLGAGIDRDGNPGPVLLSRLVEAVHEYERGVAPRVIVTGGEQHGHIQAAVMARVVESQGVPASAVFQEPRADDTVQNACFSERIMKEHGWRTAEVVTSPSHLARANLIFSHFPLQWRGHAAPHLSSEQGPWYETPLELLKTARYVTYARWTESCEP